MDRTEWIFYRLKHLAVGGPEAGTRTFRIAHDEYFVSFRIDNTSPGITCEAASNAVLPASLALKPEQDTALRKEGFTLPQGARTYILQRPDMKEKTIRDLAVLALKVIQGIYVPDEESTWEFEFSHEGARSPHVLHWLAVSFLRELLAEGREKGLLALESGRVYSQFAITSGKKSLYCELVSNQYLPKELQLSPTNLDLVISHGFQISAEQGNFSRSYPLEDPIVAENAIWDILSLFSEAYGLNPIPRFKIVLTLEST